VIVAEPGGPVERVGLGTRMVGWVKHHVPTRESIEANRWLRPVAHRILVPSLWRFTRRSVPRGVALGLFSGVLFPFAHMGIAATLALPFRANVPAAVGVTLLNNPITIGPLMIGAYEIGHWVLRLDRAVPGRPLASNVKANEGILHWLVVQGGPSAIIGLVIIAVVLAFFGYFVTALLWRFRIARKWRRRHVKTGN
jgi:hypothetical protein